MIQLLVNRHRTGVPDSGGLPNVRGACDICDDNGFFRNARDGSIQHIANRRCEAIVHPSTTKQPGLNPAHYSFAERDVDECGQPEAKVCDYRAQGEGLESERRVMGGFMSVVLPVGESDGDCLIQTKYSWHENHEKEGRRKRLWMNQLFVY